MPDDELRGSLRGHQAELADRAGEIAVLSPQSQDWERELCSATARVNAGWVLPETRCHPAIAEELAALLCAYHESA